MHHYRSGNHQTVHPRPGALVLGCLLLMLLGSTAMFAACTDQPDPAQISASPDRKSGESSLSKTAQAQSEAIGSAESTPTLTRSAISNDDITATAEEGETRVASTNAAELVTAASQAEETATAVYMATLALDYRGQATATEEAQKIKKLEAVQADPTFAGPLRGYMEAAEGEKPIPGSADVNLRNFVASTRFTFRPPGDPSVDMPVDDGEPAGFTLQFRGSSDGYTALVLYEDGRWELAIYDGQSITSNLNGQLYGLDPEGWNHLDLYVDEVRGFFLLNGRFITQLSLDSTQHSGDIAIAMGLPTSHESIGAGIDYDAFSVWAMEPILPTPTHTPTLTPYPTITPATPRPPEGLGLVLLINDTEDRPLSVDLPECPGFIGNVDGGTRIDCLMPEGSYDWRAWGWGCERELPPLTLVRDTLVVLRVIRTDRDCDYTLSLCIGEICDVLEPNRQR